MKENCSETITIRVQPTILSKLKEIAREKQIKYQALIKLWITDRISQETTKKS